MESRDHAGVETTKLVIDLDTSRRNQQVPAGELVQRRRYEELKAQVLRHLKSVESEKSVSPHPSGMGWVSFIDGTRGAGKSTFLVAAMQGFRDDLDVRSQLAAMDLIDPSRVERSEIILLAILRLLKKRVEIAIRERRDMATESDREEWNKAFRRVAGGLSLFAPQHHPLDGLDPELFLEWGLERAAHSADLRQNLQRLFDAACKLIRVKALMFAFDDADTDATHAINLLECIRKYLDTPRVMVVVTGDMELYSLLVRQHFLRSVIDGQETSVHADRGFFDRDRRGQHLRMIGHLEEQYLLKLFPLQERLHLLPLWNLLQEETARNRTYVLRNENWEGVTPEVHQFVRQIVRQGFRLKSEQDVEAYTEFLLKQPLRSVMQILARCAPSVPLLDGDMPANVWSLELSQALVSGLRALTLTSLYRYDVDTDAIASRELPALCDAVFKLALRDGDVDTATYLRPTSAEQDIKNCFTALAAEVPSLLTGQPGALIRYMFYAAGSVSLFDMVRKRQLKDSNEESASLETQFRRLMGIGRKESALHWARYASAVIGTPYSINPNARVVRVGVIGLNQNSVGPFQAARQLIKDALTKEPELPFPAFALSMVDVSGTGGRTFASIFNIMGLIERLLEVRNPTADKVSRELRRAYPTLSVSSPVWDSGGGISSQEDDGHEEGGSGGDVWDLPMQNLAERIFNWLNDIGPLRDAVSPSAVLTGKIWTRLYFSLEKASDDLRGKAGVSSLMEIFALCVINAFLVEEMDHHLLSADVPDTSRSGYDRNNPRTSASTYVNKLSKLAPSCELLPLTAIIATCPLLLGLLNPKNSYALALKGFFTSTTDINSLLCSEFRWKRFERIAVQGPKAKDPDLTSRQTQVKKINRSTEVATRDDVPAKNASEQKSDGS